MSKTPTVSINLCCYNSEKYLEETLRSVFAQTFTDWELVVVNDGSADSTEEIIQRHRAEGRRIVYHFRANAGLGAARNKAVELSRGEFIALIDHDDLWRPEKLERQLALFTGRPEVGLVYSGAVILVSSKPARVYRRQVRMYRGQILIPLVLGNFIVCSSIVIRRTVLDKVGCFNPELKQAEEYDLLVRIAENYECDYVDEPLVTWRMHPKNASWDSFRLHYESIALIPQILERTPWLSRELGRNVTRIKQAGLQCKMGEAYLLQGRLRMARGWYGSWGKVVSAVPRVAALYLLSFLSHSVIASLISLVFRVRKRKALVDA